jgi:hypothetical protein
MKIHIIVSYIGLLLPRVWILRKVKCDISMLKPGKSEEYRSEFITILARNIIFVAEYFK